MIRSSGSVFDIDIICIVCILLCPQETAQWKWELFQHIVQALIEKEKNASGRVFRRGGQLEVRALGRRKEHLEQRN